MTKTLDEKIDDMLENLDRLSAEMEEEARQKEESAMSDYDSKTHLSIEEYVEFNKKTIENTYQFMANYKANGFGLWPDLWPENTKGLNEDVRSKVKFFQIPKSVRFWNQLELNSRLEKQKETLNAIN